MIRRHSALVSGERCAMGGKGLMNFTQILNTKEEMVEKGRLYAHNTLKPGCSVGWHIHNGDMEVYYMLKGQGTYSDNGTLVEVQAGDMMYCADGEGHMLENTSQEDLEFIAMILFT